MFNLVWVGKEWAGPVFPHPLSSNFMFYACSGQDDFFPTPLTICTTVFPNIITLCIRLMFNLVRVGNEWAGPVFPHPLKSKGNMCIHDRVRLAAFFADDWLTICTTVFSHPITFWTRLMFNLVRVGKEWASPVFPHPLKSKGYMWIHDRVRLAAFSADDWLTICTTVFSHTITFWTRLMFNLVRVGKEWAGPVFPNPLKSKGYMCIHNRVGLALFFRRRFTICTTVFTNPITFWIMLMFNLVRVGKEWAGPVFPHPLTINFMFYAYSGQGNLRLAELFPTPLTICTTVFHKVITLCIRLMFNLVRVGKEWAGPVFPQPLTSNFMFYAFPHPLKSKGYMCIHDRVRLAVFFADD